MSTTHPRGRHKAYVFAHALGLTASDAPALRRRLLAAALDDDARIERADEFGQRYSVDFQMEYMGKIAVVRSAWIVLAGENFPRFTTCYVLEERENR